MILIDTSAWVEFLRDTGSATCNRVEALLESEIAICDVVRMEVLAGARDERHLHHLRRLLARATIFPTGAMHYDDAAALYRLCRREGETVCKLIDCPHWRRRHSRPSFITPPPSTFSRVIRT